MWIVVLTPAQASTEKVGLNAGREALSALAADEDCDWRDGLDEGFRPRMGCSRVSG